MTAPLRIVVQARTNSHRLPAKALLPIAGLPSAALAVKRVSGGGNDVVVATSADAGDDNLADILGRSGIAVVRGPLEDVLGRFVEAARDLPDAATIVRLTADNVFPDADFVRLFAARLAEGDCDFVGVEWPKSRLPYGVAAEAMRLGVLREAAAHATDRYDREHVTSWIRRNRQCRLLDVPVLADISHVRATIDSLDDYLDVCRTFAGLDVNAATAIGWRDLCARHGESYRAFVNQLKPEIVDGRFQTPLILGAAQLGIDYGIANKTGQPDARQATCLIRDAVRFGITHVDTARGYGTSEQRIGAALADGWQDRLSVMTKLLPVGNVSKREATLRVEASITASQVALKRERIDCLLLHRAEDLAIDGVLDRLREFAAQGCIAKFGVSVQSVAELDAALAIPDVRLVQLPFNLFDHRWDDGKAGEKLARRPDVAVHARSCLLQGLLVLADEVRLRAIGGDELAAGVRNLQSLAAELCRTGVVDLAYAYVRGVSWIDALVVGMENGEQLRENVGYFRNRPLSPSEIARVNAARPQLGEAVLNPARWPAATGAST